MGATFVGNKLAKSKYFSMKPILFDLFHQIACFLQLITQYMLKCPNTSINGKNWPCLDSHFCENAIAQNSSISKFTCIIVAPVSLRLGLG